MEFEIMFIVVAVIGYVVFMVKRTIETLNDADKAIMSLAYVLDNVRYTIMFVSFLATQILGYIAINNLLDNYSMPSNFSMVVNVLVFISTVLVSALITISIVQSERAIAEGGYSKEQFITIAIILGSMSVIDYNSLKEGAVQVYSQIEQYKVKEIKQIDNLTAISLNSTIAQLNQKQNELKELNEIISYSDKKEKLKLSNRRDKISRDIERLSNKVTLYNTRIKAEQKKEIKTLKIKNKESIKSIGEMVIGLMLLAFLSSSARTILLKGAIIAAKEDEYEGIELEPAPAHEIKQSKSEIQQEYIIRAMKEYADQKGYRLEQSESMHGLKFARDDVVSLARALASKDKIILEIGNPTAQRLIDNPTIRQIVGDYLREKTLYAA